MQKFTLTKSLDSPTQKQKKNYIKSFKTNSRFLLIGVNYTSYAKMKFKKNFLKFFDI